MLPGEKLRQGERGAVSFLPDGQAIINLLQGADPSTIPHELAHVSGASRRPQALHPQASAQGESV
ncbi:MAG: hypothetical protein ACOZHQ_06165 [Thermodesulfobacteriota bacterium]